MKRFNVLTVLGGLLLGMLLTAQTWAATYEIDPEHSSISFKIRHLVSKTQGQFKKFSGTVEFDDKEPKNSKVQTTIDVASLDTGVKKRDDHLLGDADFFDVKKYPTMKFESAKVSKIRDGGKKAEIVGNLTMHGVTKPVILEVVMTGTTINPFSKNPVIGFSGNTKIDRRQWNITWNHEEKGKFILGDEVEIILEIEAIQKSTPDSVKTSQK